MSILRTLFRVHEMIQKGVKEVFRFLTPCFTLYTVQLNLDEGVSRFPPNNCLYS